MEDVSGSARKDFGGAEEAVGEGEEMRIWIAEFRTVHNIDLVAVYDHKPSDKEKATLWVKEQQELNEYEAGEDEYKAGEAIKVRGPFGVRTKK